MAKKKGRGGESYLCGDCGFVHPQWVGQCQECGAWGSLVAAPSGGAAHRSGSKTSAPARGSVNLASLSGKALARIGTGIAEFDRALGGGLVPGSMVLLGGEPGIGKSTLLLQVAAAMAGAGRRVVYACGEEAPEQVALRARRLGIAGAAFTLLPETRVEVLCEAACAEAPDLVVIDSVQTARSEALPSTPGSPAQIRAACAQFLERFKAAGIACVLVGHVTKEGSIAGPKLLEHMVDTVLAFEGDVHHLHRFVRAVKNRFGPSGEVGVFSMTGGGLEEVANPSSCFVDEDRGAVAGSAVLPLVEGSRAVMVEVQALVTGNAYAMPRRMAQGIDVNRVSLLVSVIEKRLRMPLGGSDVFLNVTGGVQVREPAGDLAVVAAILSSHLDRPLPRGSCFLGEVGLGGELRPVVHLEKRVAEARRLGYDGIVIPGAGGGAAFADRGCLPIRDLSALHRRWFGS